MEVLNGKCPSQIDIPGRGLRRIEFNGLGGERSPSRYGNTQAVCICNRFWFIIEEMSQVTEVGDRVFFIEFTDG
ncbi:MAG: hypothetical protein D4R67_01530 [Bacteroidetes bacterium]|nr:MAG: hypothetical protein D4R67_01530 [Bacteroidota bacterium]